MKNFIALAALTSAIVCTAPLAHAAENKNGKEPVVILEGPERVNAAESELKAEIWGERGAVVCGEQISRE